MKKILIQVWDPKEKTMSIGMEIPMLAGFLMAKYPNLDKEIYRQATGLLDPRLKEIYDGDILLYKKEIVMVGFKNSKKNDNFELKKRKNPRVEMHYWEVFMSPKGQWCVRRGDVIQSLLKAAENHTVAGNIYQTPELLKENA